MRQGQDWDNPQGEVEARWGGPLAPTHHVSGLQDSDINTVSKGYNLLLQKCGYCVAGIFAGHVDNVLWTSPALLGAAN